MSEDKLLGIHAYTILDFPWANSSTCCQDSFPQDPLSHILFYQVPLVIQLLQFQGFAQCLVMLNNYRSCTSYPKLTWSNSVQCILQDICKCLLFVKNAMSSIMQKVQTWAAILGIINKEISGFFCNSDFTVKQFRTF